MTVRAWTTLRRVTRSRQQKEAMVGSRRLKLHCARKRWLVLPATMRQPLLRSRLASPAKRIDHIMCCQRMEERETVSDLFEATRCPTVSMPELGIGLLNRHHCSFWPLPWTTSSISQAIHIA